MSAVEEWKQIPGYEGLYEVSDQGRVRSLDRVVRHSSGGGSLLRNGSALRSESSHSRYNRVSLYRDVVPARHLVHRLVLLAFVGEAPAGLEACHGNGNPRDNRLENLRWDTHKNNQSDKLLHGTHSRGERSVVSRLTEAQAYRVKFGGERGISLAREFAVSRYTIYDIRNGRTWAWLQPTEADEMAALLEWVANLPEGAAA